MGLVGIWHDIVYNDEKKGERRHSMYRLTVHVKTHKKWKIYDDDDDKYLQKRLNPEKVFLLEYISNVHGTLYLWKR